MLAELKVGPQGTPADGNPTPQRGTRTGEQLISQAHARYYEAVARGNCYGGMNAAAITFGTALTATGVTFHLYNPFGSGVNLCILKTVISIITCTTAGTIGYAVNTNPSAAAPATTTAITINNCLVGSSKVGNAKLYSVATLPVAPTWLRNVSASEGTTPLGSPSATLDDVNGEIVIAPGCTISIQGLTIAGTGVIGMTWEECPVT